MAELDADGDLMRHNPVKLKALVEGRAGRYTRLEKETGIQSKSLRNYCNGTHKRIPRKKLKQIAVALGVKDINELCVPEIVSQPPTCPDGMCEVVKQDIGLKRMMDRLMDLRRTTTGNPHLARHMEEDICARIEDRKANPLPKPVEYLKDGEFARTQRLLSAVKDAKIEFLAVTLVAGNYLQSFFGKKSADGYLEEQAKAIRRNVRVGRVFLFVCDPFVVTPEDDLLLRKLVREHLERGIDVCVIHAPGDQWKTSFAVCDSQVWSESHPIPEAEATSGYVGYDPVSIRRLKNQYERLLGLGDDITGRYRPDQPS